MSSRARGPQRTAAILLEQWDRWRRRDRLRLHRDSVAGGERCATRPRRWRRRCGHSGIAARRNRWPHARELRWPFRVALVALLRIGCNPLLIHAGRRRQASTVSCRRSSAFAGCSTISSRASRFFRPTTTPSSAGSSSAISARCCRPASTPAALPVPGGRGPRIRRLGTYGAARYCMRNQSAAVAEGRNYTELSTSIARRR